MSNEYIKKSVDKLVKRNESRDPFEIADNLKIHVIFHNNFNMLKGMYKVIKRSRFIFINSNLNHTMQKIVCAHELGHDQLHRELASKTILNEFDVYRIDTKTEYEANMFAAELLLPNDELFKHIDSGYTAEQIAKAENTDVNLIYFKVEFLIEQGYDLNEFEYKSNFLKY